MCRKGQDSWIWEGLVVFDTLFGSVFASSHSCYLASNIYPIIQLIMSKWYAAVFQNSIPLYSMKS